MLFEEGSSLYPTLDVYIAYIAKDSNIKTVKEFVFNGFKGVVVTNISSTIPNYELAYDHKGRLVIISSSRDANITPDILINILETATLAI